MIVLDTHALVWWLDGGAKLSDNARQRIGTQREEERSILVSSISVWEIAMLVAKERLVLRMDIASWLEQAGRVDAIRFCPVDNEIALQSTRLPGEFHNDPADRMIVALARHYSSPLITADEKIRNYRHVQTLW